MQNAKMGLDPVEWEAVDYVWTEVPHAYRLTTTDWQAELSPEDSIETLRHLALCIAEHRVAGGGTFPVDLLQGVTERNWLLVINYKIDYECPTYNVEDFRAIRQVIGFFKKLECLPLAGVDKEANAIEKFMWSEEQCKKTNFFLKHLYHGGVANALASPSPYVVRLIELARSKIHGVLKECPRASKIVGHFGPGAVVGMKKADANPSNKMALGMQCSTDMWASGLLPTYLSNLPHWVDEQMYAGDEPPVTHIRQNSNGGFDRYYMVEVELVTAEVICVPKNAVIYRIIIKESNLCAFIQQGVREVFEERLEAAGLGTKDQTKNQRLAKEGSLSGALATLDLTSASDLKAYQLIKRLYPHAWFRLMCSCRSGTVRYGHQELTLEKFSSMGNAVTFPLETLTFWAIVTSALDLAGVPHDASNVAVYGDDIIVPVAGYAHVRNALHILGLSVNEAKSYSTGPFRESCGVDCWKGIDIRPYHQEQPVSGQTLFSMHNFFYRLGNFEMAEEIMAMIPPSMALKGPDGYGDGHLLSDNWADTTPMKLRKDGYAGATFETYVEESRVQKTRYPAAISPILYAADTSGSVPPLQTLEPWAVQLKNLEPARGFTESLYKRIPWDVFKWPNGETWNPPLWVVPGKEKYKVQSIYEIAPR